MSDETEISVLMLLGIGPGVGVLLTHMLGAHNFWLLTLGLLAGFGCALLALVALAKPGLFDERGWLRTPRRKTVLNTLRWLAIVVIGLSGGVNL